MKGVFPCAPAFYAARRVGVNFLYLLMYYGRIQL